VLLHISILLSLTTWQWHLLLCSILYANLSLLKLTCLQLLLLIQKWLCGLLTSSHLSLLNTSTYSYPGIACAGFWVLTQQMIHITHCWYERPLTAHIRGWFVIGSTGTVSECLGPLLGL
jgi:hypothetical protein